MYPKNWVFLATSIKQEARWCCQKCGLQCLPRGENTSGITKSQRRSCNLQVHHWNRDPADNRKENLIALCPACHDYRHRGGKSNVSPGQLS